MKTNLRSRILASFAALLSLSAFAQNNPLGGVLTGVTSFQKIKVTQEAVFQGKVMFDNGLTLNGDAKFLNNILGDGSLSIAKNVRFSGLIDLTTADYILTGNTSGDLARIPFALLAQQLSNLDNLTVRNLTTLNGQLNLGNGLLIRGAANFANDVAVDGNTTLAGNLTLSSLTPSNGTVLPGTMALGVDANGKIIILPEGNMGLPTPSATICTEPGLPAYWERSVNKLVTDYCSKNVRVGIGTQQPRSMLDVFGSATIEGKMGVGVANPIQKLDVRGSIYTTGRIGINIESPTEAIDASGNVKLTGGVFAGRKTGIYGVRHEFIGKMAIGNYTGQGTDAASNNILELGYDGSHVYLNSSSADNGQFQINYFSNAPVTFGRADNPNASKVYLNGGAYVGEVKNTATQYIEKGELLLMGKDGFEQSGQKATAYFGDRSYGITSVKGFGMALMVPQGGQALAILDNGRVSMGKNGNVVNARLHLNASVGENILIAEVNNQEKFRVSESGKTYATEVNVKLAPFPDYVFEKNYQLLSLPQLEQYIASNGHLPGMPTANEVAREGADLGELVRLLVEKNEEMTLHLIRLQKELNELKANQK